MSTTNPDVAYACTVLLLFTKPTKPNENGTILTCWLMGCTSMRTSSSAGPYTEFPSWLMTITHVPKPTARSTELSYVHTDGVVTVIVIGKLADENPSEEKYLEEPKLIEEGI